MPQPLTRTERIALALGGAILGRRTCFVARSTSEARRFRRELRTYDIPPQIRGNIVVKTETSMIRRPEPPECRIYLAALPPLKRK